MLDDDAGRRRRRAATERRPQGQYDSHRVRERKAGSRSKSKTDLGKRRRRASIAFSFTKHSAVFRRLLTLTPGLSGIGPRGGGTSAGVVGALEAGYERRG
jgi:hypothetical protein